jgi:pimeloyl-ACP methyl ester carboxylesterase
LGYKNNRTAHAWVLRHRGAPRPWLVCLHGYGCGTRSLDFAAFRVAWLYRTLGLNVALPVLPLHGPRAHGWRSGQGFFGGDVLDTLHAEAQAVWDVRRLLSWIRRQGSPPIGIYGLSLGGYGAAVIAALERELSCIIAGIPASDFVRLAQMHNAPSLLRLAQECGLDWEEIGSLYKVISPLKLTPLVPRERRFIFGGRGDCIVPPDHVQDLWEHWDRPAINWYDGSHFSFYWEPAVTQFIETAVRATLFDNPLSPESTGSQTARR